MLKWLLSQLYAAISDKLCGGDAGVKAIYPSIVGDYAKIVKLLKMSPSGLCGPQYFREFWRVMRLY